VVLTVAACMAAMEAHLNAADATPSTGGAPLSPEHADGLDERPLPLRSPGSRLPSAFVVGCGHAWHHFAPQWRRIKHGRRG
jgi:hypothetical protein